MLIRSGAKSATGWADRQISLHCLGVLRRNIERARTFFSDAWTIDASNRKPATFRMRLGGTLEPVADRAHPAADDGSQSSRIGEHDHDEASQEHPQPERGQVSGVLT
jgi:hypothetical protein